MTYYFPPDASCNDVSEGNYKAFIRYINRLIDCLNYYGLFTCLIYHIHLTLKHHITIVYEKYAIDMHLFFIYILLYYE